MCSSSFFSNSSVESGGYCGLLRLVAEVEDRALPEPLVMRGAPGPSACSSTSSIPFRERRAARRT